MGSNGTSQGQRVTMLIDDELYRTVKSNACGLGMKTYEYINMVLAKAVGRKVPKIKHPSKQDIAVVDDSDPRKNEATQTKEGVV